VYPEYTISNSKYKKILKNIENRAYLSKDAVDGGYTY